MHVSVCLRPPRVAVGLLLKLTVTAMSSETGSMLQADDVPIQD